MKVSVKQRRAYFTDITVEELEWVRETLTWNLGWGKTDDFRSLVYETAEGLPYTLDGLLPLLQELGKFPIEVREPAAAPPIFYEVPPDLIEGVTLYPFQCAAIQKALAWKRGIEWIPTGGGKGTLIFAMLRRMRQLGLLTGKVLIVVPSTVLAKQMKRRAIKQAGFAEEEVGAVFQGSNEWKRDIVIAVRDSVTYGIRDGKPRVLDFLADVQVFVVDECHHLQSETWMEIDGACINSEYQIGWSGTPWHGDPADHLNSIRDATLFGLLARVVFQVSHRHLREIGLCAQPIVHFVMVSGRMIRGRGRFDKIYDKHIVNNKTRNKKILETTRRFMRIGFPVLQLIQRKEHGELLLRGLPEGAICVFGGGKALSYEDDGQIVERPIDHDLFAEDFEAGKYAVAIASQVFDEGVDLPAIACVVMAGGGKSPIRINQRAGRGARAKKSSFNQFYIIDFCDRNHVYLHSQYKKRRKIYEQMEAIIVDNEGEFFNMVYDHVDDLDRIEREGDSVAE